LIWKLIKSFPGQYYALKDKLKKARFENDFSPYPNVTLVQTVAGDQAKSQTCLPDRQASNFKPLIFAP
jgi:hypothetical protein